MQSLTLKIIFFSFLCFGKFGIIHHYLMVLITIILGIDILLFIQISYVLFAK